MKLKKKRKKLNYGNRALLERKLRWFKQGNWTIHFGYGGWIIVKRCPRKLKKRLKYYGSDFMMHSIPKVVVLLKRNN